MSKDMFEVFKGRCFRTKKEYTVSLSVEVYSIILALMKKFPDLEWSGDLIGVEAGVTIQVNRIFIPKQEVTSTSVARIEAPPRGCIGVIHSHHGMGSFFSGTDIEYSSSNHRLSMVVSKSGSDVKMSAMIREPLPCGDYTLIEAKEVVISVADVENEVNNMAKKIIVKKPQFDIEIPRFTGGFKDIHHTKEKKKEEEDWKKYLRRLWGNEDE